MRIDEPLSDLVSVLGEHGAAAWLRTPNAAMGGRKPEAEPLEELLPLVRALLDGAYP